MRPRPFESDPNDTGPGPLVMAADGQRVIAFDRLERQSVSLEDALDIL